MNCGQRNQKKSSFYFIFATRGELLNDDHISNKQAYVNDVKGEINSKYLYSNNFSADHTALIVIYRIRDNCSYIKNTLIQQSDLMRWRQPINFLFPLYEIRFRWKKP